MTTDLQTTCWDTCIYIAWFQGDKQYPLDAIQEQALAIMEGELHLIVPTMVIAEFHSIKDHRKAVEQFDRWIRSDCVTIADLTPALAELAGDIRSTATTKITSMDAVFVATSQHRKVDTAWTVDKKLIKAIGKHEKLGGKSRFRYPGEGELPLEG